MPPAKPARWTARPAEVTTRVDAKTGAFSLSAPLYDDGVKTLTVTLSVDANRKARLDVHGEPGAHLAGLEAWSDV